ncbi:MAG: SprT-like domain-containing protein [Acidobacteriota bacterium]|nr:SprT-like domain-containing protein [Acidobacteriota bacterium]
MSFAKVHLLIGLFACGIGILFVQNCASPPIAEIPAAPSNQPVVKIPDSRFDRAVRDKNLQAKADALLPLFDRMPSVPVYLTDEPIVQTGTNVETSDAYTHCDAHEYPSIFVKRIHYQTTNQKRLTNTLKHELTHAWLCRQNLMAEGHGIDFRRKFKAIGGWGIGTK